MGSFPVLSSGAFAQYPLSRVSGFATETIEFLDGSSQRCPVRGRKRRKWLLNLNLLSEAELAALEEFFASQLGNYSPFPFTDPFTGELIPACRFSDSSLLTKYFGTAQGGTSIWLEETNG